MFQLIVEFQQTHIFDFDEIPTGRDVKCRLFEKEGIPADLITLTSNDSNILDDDEVGRDEVLFIRASLMSGLCGGKGGFGAQLRALAKQKAYRKTVDFGACRDLSGRRLRHVNDEILLQKWQEAKDNNVAFEADGETATGIDLWYLSAPSWAEGVKVDKRKIFMKPRMKTSMCIDWKRARENRPAPDGAPAHWGCPRGRRCEFAHGIAELRGDAQQAMIDAKEQEKCDAVNKKKDDYMDVLYRSNKAEEDLEDLVMAGLRAAKRAKLGVMEAHTVEETLEDAEDAVSVQDSAEEDADEAVSMDYFTALSGTVVVAKATSAVSTTSTSSSSSNSTSKSNNGSALLAAPAVCPILTGTSAFATVVVDKCNLVVPAHSGSVSRWYYEVELRSDGLMQLGWANSQFIANFHSSQAAQVTTNDDGAESAASAASGVEADGVGDDAHSWAFDGYRQQKWHAGMSAPYGPQTGAIWQAGDVVGCYLTLHPAQSTRDSNSAAEEEAGPKSAAKEKKRKVSDEAAATVSTVRVGSIAYTVNGVTHGPAFEVIVPEEGAGDLQFFPAFSLESSESVLLNLGNSVFKYPPSEVPTSAGAAKASTSGKKGTPAKGKKAAPVEAVEVVEVIECRSVWTSVLTCGDTETEVASGSDSNNSNNNNDKSSTLAPAVVPAVAAVVPVEVVVHEAVDLEADRYADLAAVEALGLVHLKQELERRGLKTGGTLQERAKRLHSVRGVAADKIDPKLLAKKA